MIIFVITFPLKKEWFLFLYNSKFEYRYILWMVIFFHQGKDVITYSKGEAMRLGQQFIGTEHLMLGALRAEQQSNSNIEQYDVDLEHLRRKVEILNLRNEQK
jgi:uncharacterized membrane protein